MSKEIVTVLDGLPVNMNLPRLIFGFTLEKKNVITKGNGESEICKKMIITKMAGQTKTYNLSCVYSSFNIN